SFHATARSEIYTLSLHDALPISASSPGDGVYGDAVPTITAGFDGFQYLQTAAVLTSPAVCSTTYTHDATSGPGNYPTSCTGAARSEEHTSELQSRFDLVCRLLLE